MTAGHLSDYFTGVASKRLRSVEVDPNSSNQHEFNGVNGLRRMLGEAEPQAFDARFLYLTDDESDSVVADHPVTWYDSRRNQARRSAEYRLYFPASPVMELASEGDLLVVAKRREGGLLIVVAESGTTFENQIRWLFGLDEPEDGYSVQDEGDADRIDLDYVKKLILEQIGVEIEDTADDYLDEMLRRFGGRFPTTKEFSAFARSTLPDLTVEHLPDELLLDWMEREETLFRTLERHFVRERLLEGFGDDVDEFVSFSLSVHNRRKSRAGYAFENHLMAILDGRSIRYSRGKETEHKAKPDYLFPGVEEYHEASFPTALLTMLGAKTSCKDRWRQVLSEAARIDEKHLLTLEPGISENQTNEMRGHHVQLVIPARLHPTFTDKQQRWLMPLGDFIDLVAERQSRCP